VFGAQEVDRPDRDPVRHRRPPGHRRRHLHFGQSSDQPDPRLHRTLEHPSPAGRLDHHRRRDPDQVHIAQIQHGKTSRQQPQAGCVEGMPIGKSQPGQVIYGQFFERDWAGNRGGLWCPSWTRQRTSSRHLTELPGRSNLRSTSCRLLGLSAISSVGCIAVSRLCPYAGCVRTEPAGGWTMASDSAGSTSGSTRAGLPSAPLACVVGGPQVSGVRSWAGCTRSTGRWYRCFAGSPPS
jgi:hypothetical protein